MAKYKISEDSESQRASVDDKELEGGDDPIELTKGQVERLEAAGVELTESKGGSSSTSSGSSGSSSSND